MDTLQNEPASSLTHLIGATLSVAALVVMVVFASLWGSVYHIVGYSIFGCSLVLLYTMSTLYHWFKKESKAKRMFQYLDHSMIFVLIAGTYTALTLTMPQKAWGWTLFGIIWGLAAIGITLKNTCLRMKHNWINVALYLIMGWLIVIAAKPVADWLTKDALLWLFAGGLSYTVGVIFFALDHRIRLSKHFTLHDIFHLFVLAGSACHVWLMLTLVT